MTKHLWWLSLAVLAMLSGCDSGGQDEVQTWMKEERTRTRPQVEPIPEPKKFVPLGYSQDRSTDPFSKDKLTEALKRETNHSAKSAALIAPEMARRREPLESYPLDAMRMVGSLVKLGQPVALLRVDNLLYQVRPGNYLGQNYGRITKVSDSEVVLREIVQDATGEWTERMTTLQLQER